MKYIPFLFLLLSGFACTTPSEQEVKMVIAHAGGSINAERYLNSQEAVQQSIRRGFRYIELDLLETPDGDLVAAHDWKTFHQLTGYPAMAEPISAQEAKKRKILKKQTVLTSQEIREIFMQHTHIYLVTDKIRNMRLVREKFAPFLNRVIVELKFLEECDPENISGVAGCAFLFKKSAIPDNKTALLATIPLRKLDENKKWLQQHPNVQVLVYTVNDVQLAKKLLSYPFVKGIYSDFLSPRLLQEAK